MSSESAPPTVATGARRHLADAVAGAALVLSIAGMAVALAALLFSGPLASGLPRATGTFLFASGLGAAWLAARSRVVPLVTILQDAPAVLLVAIVAAVAKTHPSIDAGDVTVLIGLSTAVAAVAMIVLGAFGLGEAVRFLPTVVINGFIAGTGWLLVRGGVEVMVDARVPLSEADRLLEASYIARWAPGVGLAVVVLLVVVARRLPETATAVAVIAATAIFYVATGLFSSVDAIRDDGWLIGPFDGSAVPVPLTPGDLADADWAAFGSETVGIGSLVLVTVIALLLNLSALEATRRRRLDTSYELRQAGVVNLAAAAMGAIPQFHALGDTVLAERIGVRGRLVPVLAGLAVAAFGILGAEAVGLTPVFVAGGLLLAVGVSLLVEWVGFLRGPIGWVDRVVSSTVLGVIMFVGVLEAVLIGLVLACAVFLVRYSRIDPVRRAHTGATARSRVERTEAEARLLDVAADRVRVFELQGYLFFGSVTRLIEQIRTTTLRGDASLDALVLDLRFVTGVEPGTAHVFDPLLGELAAHDVSLIVSGPDPAIREALAGTTPAGFDTLDDALAHVEQQMLDHLRTTLVDDGLDEVTEPLPERPPLDPAWLDTFERAEAPSGATLLSTGDPGDELIYLIEGVASIYATSTDGERHRIRRFVGPAWLGEAGFLHDKPRRADVVADSTLRYAFIDRPRFEHLRSREPQVAIELLEDIAASAAGRTNDITEVVARLLD